MEAFLTEVVDLGDTGCAEAVRVGVCDKLRRA